MSKKKNIIDRFADEHGITGFGIPEEYEGEEADEEISYSFKETGDQK